MSVPVFTPNAPVYPAAFVIVLLPEPFFRTRPAPVSGAENVTAPVWLNCSEPSFRRLPACNVPAPAPEPMFISAPG